MSIAGAKKIMLKDLRTEDLFVRLYSNSGCVVSLNENRKVGF